MKSDKGMGTVGARPKKDPLDDDYEAQGHFDTVMRAHEIMKDETKMEKVRAIAGRKAESITGFNDSLVKKAPKKPKINRVSDIKAIAQSMRASKKDM